MGGAAGGEEQLPSPPGFTLQLILNAVYGQAYQIDDENANALLVASNYLEVPSVQTACCKHLRQQIACDTCWTTLATAVRFGCDTLCADAMEYIRRMFEQQGALPNHTALHALSKDVMLELLHSPALQFGSEAELFQAVLIWIAGDAAARLADLPELLTAVRPPGGLWNHLAADNAANADAITTAGAVANLAALLVRALEPGYLLDQELVGMDRDMADFCREHMTNDAYCTRAHQASLECLLCGMTSLCAHSSANRQAFQAAGALKALQQLHSSPTPGIKANAAMALDALRHGSPN
ncbi:hypothetical protein WJX72_002315 [[Myrmecia] bisecta]|uniref:BACK domain-containing protein n=1 Tax=[Myrmecia] bisecta TaxID=41462 RepID=A0AAW1P7X5_9CHLO